MDLDLLTDLGEPSEDSGALTQSRFRFQCECIASVCIAMLTQEALESVTCEWHEDYIIRYQSGDLELVSVKHREPAQGAWSLSELCNRGGLVHLFERWQLAPQRTTCRISTNAGLKTGVDEAGELAEACAHVQSGNTTTTQRIAEFAETIAHVILLSRKRRTDGTPTSDGKRKRSTKSQQTTLDLLLDPELTSLKNDVQEFLSVLQIESDLPGRQHIRSHNIVKLMAPALTHLGRNSADAEDCYDNFLPTVEDANRDHDSQPRSLAAYLADPRRLAWDKKMLEKIGRRTIRRQDVLHCLTSNSSTGVRLAPSTSAAPISPTTLPANRLTRKLQAGGLGPTAIHNAKNLRSLWLETWAEFRTDLPGDAAELADLRARVSHLAAQAEGETRGPESYGVAMNQRLAELLKPNLLGRSFPIKLDPLHLLGLAYDLCDECAIWFSEPFEFSGDMA